MKNLFLLLFVIFSFQLFSQEKQQSFKYLYPYDDVLIKQKCLENPDIATKYIIYEENLRNIINASKSGVLTGEKADTLINGRRIIPVVFHVVHFGGTENISKEQIEDAINLINIDYNKLNADTGVSNTYPAFNAIRANCNMEFRLAKVDPDGNCTDGIVRHYDPQTNYGYFQTMTDYCWTPSRYLNIFTVNFIYPEGMALPDGAFIGGMSPFPPSNTLSQALTGGDTLADGVLIRHDCIGSIGTATDMGGMPINAQNRTFTHESGHYFNLYHPFQNLMFGMIPTTDGCPSLIAPNGDEVDDTPPVQAATQNTSISCYVPGSRNTCTNDDPDLPDMIENFMDYQWGYCTNIFTEGQYDRIDATMMSDRRKLWSKENLIYTGVLDTSASVCAPIAEFFPGSNMVCAGSNILFTDYSYSGNVQEWLWTFDGGDPSTSTDPNPSVTYNTPGIYNVKLKVSNTYGSDSLTKQNLITVKSIDAGAATPFVEDFENTMLNNGWTLINNAGNAWEITDTAYYSGLKSIRIKNFSGNIAGSTDELITPSYDFTGLPTDGTPFLKFKLAYAGKIIPGTLGLTEADTAYDMLKVYSSTDCGKSWSLKYEESGEDLASTLPTQNSFAPNSETQWKEIVRPLPYMYLTNNHVMLRFVFYSNSGNNLYVDDINITSNILGIGDMDLPRISLSVNPNPVSDISELSFSLSASANTKIIVYNILGKEIMMLEDKNLSAGKHLYTLNKNDIGPAGIYFIKASFENYTLVEKFVVK
ncbi:MAG: PKD domain-containing protein [Bacteroidales bacterium]|jgi:PKD repeat protein|nr:PKD domain-containing protein [Bacteroidales bacterium]